jgi:transcriptional regulator with GAF, ATPase, and Fis domain
MVKNKLFREDLWFRLNVFPITIPPLRDRTSDIPALGRHLIERKAKELKLSETPELAPGSINALMSYQWPGNVRELENLIERSLILHRSEPLQFEDLVSFPSKKVDTKTIALEEKTVELDALVKSHIQSVLEKTNGKIHGPGGAGELLGVNPNTLRYKMKKLGIPFQKKGKR